MTARRSDEGRERFEAGGSVAAARRTAFSLLQPPGIDILAVHNVAVAVCLPRPPN